MFWVMICELGFLGGWCFLYLPLQFLVILLDLQFSPECKTLSLAHAPQEGLLVVRPPVPAFPILVPESDLRSPFPMRRKSSPPPPRRRPSGRHFALPGS